MAIGKFFMEIKNRYTKAIMLDITVFAFLLETLFDYQVYFPWIVNLTFQKTYVLTYTCTLIVVLAHSSKFFPFV